MALTLGVTKDTFTFKIEENPFREILTESGIFLGDGSLFKSEETGEMEQLNQMIQFGVVTSIGPDCKTLEAGDGIFFDMRTPQPIPFREAVWVLHEGSIRAYVKDDGTLQDVIADYKERDRQERFKTSMALNGKSQPLGVTHQTAGQQGSGLKLIL